MSGNKLDLGKPPLFFNPPEIQYGMARAFAYGEQKYGRWNWMKGLEASRLLAACLRHLLAWFWECTWDAESNLSHLDHAAASLAMLMENVTRKPELDDRPIKKAPEVGAEDLNVRDPLRVGIQLPDAKFFNARREYVWELSPGFSIPARRADSLPDATGDSSSHS